MIDFAQECPTVHRLFSQYLDQLSPSILDDDEIAETVFAEGMLRYVLANSFEQHNIMCEMVLLAKKRVALTQGGVG